MKCVHRVFVAQEIGNDMNITCNTDKDKSRKKYHTAGNNELSIDSIVLAKWITYTGIVVGAWPRGIIVLMGELFGAESMSQVYGSSHTFLQENKQATNNLGIIIDPKVFMIITIDKQQNFLFMMMGVTWKSMPVTTEDTYCRAYS